MAAYAVTTIDALPSIDDEGVDWRPIQHYFGDHEEVYVVLEGEVEFTVGEETFDCARGSVVVVKDPAVRRRGVAKGPAAVLAVGAPRRERFESTWRPDHFEGVPGYDEVSKG
jgi:mannose-6-phosphate isomerase-like protein (cupin superfamily)